MAAMSALSAEQWSGVVSALQRRLGLVRTRRWLPFLILQPDADGFVVVKAPSAKASKQAQRFSAELTQALAEVLGAAPQLRFEGRAPAIPVTKEAPLSAARETRRVKGAGTECIPRPSFSPKQVFHRFVAIGNELAMRFCTDVASKPGGDFNPLVLYGPSGVGKTHLLQAVGQRFKEIFPERGVAFASADELAHRFGVATYRGAVEDFRQTYRHLDLLIVDDLQSLVTKFAFQTELLHMLDALEARGGQVAMACAVLPAQLEELPEGLRGRLMGGVCVEMKAPEASERIEVLLREQQRLGTDFALPVLREVARRVQGTTGDLLAALAKLEAFARLTQREVDAEGARQALSEMLGAADAQAATPGSIAERIAAALGLSPEAILGGSRKPAVVRGRQLAMALCRRLTTLTLSEIGRAFGRRSTGAVTFALKRTRERVTDDPELRAIAVAVCEGFGADPSLVSEL